MDTSVRKPFQGVSNIIRFNWHFYATALLGVFFLFGVFVYSNDSISIITLWILYILIAVVIISLAVSCYVYDCSGLYNLSWLDENISENDRVININAGFDESSGIIRRKFPHLILKVFDFYNPVKHTERSIERARSAYAPYPDTRVVSTESLPVESSSIQCVLNIFSLHEIRDESERIGFLKEQHRVLDERGSCLVMEHQRDLPNFLAYNIGFFHFHSARTWTSNFYKAGFSISSARKLNPFVTLYVLKKNYGTTS